MLEFIEVLRSQDHVYKLIYSFSSIFLSVLLLRIFNLILYKAIDDNTKYHKYRKINYYFFSSIVISFNMAMWIISFQNLITYLGLLSAGIAIALKEVFANIAAWIFILIRRPFDVSDRITIDGISGDVIDIRLFQFTMMEISNFDDGEQSTGRILNVPNYYVFIHPLINYNKGFEYVWSEIKVLVTFKSDWKKAKLILSEICGKHSLHFSEEATKKLLEAKKKYMIRYNHLKPIVYLDVKEHGVQLTMRYLCSTRHRRGSINDIWEDILLEFQKDNNIELAYPTIRIDQNQSI